MLINSQVKPLNTKVVEVGITKLREINILPPIGWEIDAQLEDRIWAMRLLLNTTISFTL